MVNERINPPGLIDPEPYGFSHIVTALGGDLVFVAGQAYTDTTDDGELLETDFARQVVGSFASLETALGAVGLGFADVAQATSYVVGLDAERVGTTRAATHRVWGEHPPAHTVVGVAALAAPEAHFEVEAIAVRS